MAARRFLDGFKRLFTPRIDKTLVGEDHLGNKYFEAHKPGHQWRKKQRYFKAPGVDESNYLHVEDVKVPPAWDAWLRFRKIDPPTKDEVLEGEEYFKFQQNLAAEKKLNNHDAPIEKPKVYDGTKRHMGSPE